jgi:hypothetical protein
VFKAERRQVRLGALKQAGLGRGESVQTRGGINSARTAALAEGPAVLCTVMAELRLGGQKRESTSTQSDREATSEPE